MADDEHERVVDSGVANAFLRAVALDRKAGVERTLDSYQRLFPGFEGVVAGAHADLMASQDAGSSEPEAGTENAPAPGTGPDQPVIGHYRLLREIGRGGQAVVYLAEDLRLPRQVAVKVLRHAGPLASREALLRFQAEARTASRLDDPLICPIYEVGEQGGTAFIAMRYIGGVTLARMIAEARARPADGRTLDLPSGETPGGTSSSPPAFDPAPGSHRARMGRLLFLFERVARSLHAAHGAGVIHRDIKPENLMITSEGDPVILDFGLARDESTAGDMLTVTGDIMGTPVYMSPEQHRGWRCDHRTDVWSLGVTLYEALTLRRPFDGATKHDLTQAILNDPAADPRGAAPWIGRETAAVLATALEKSLDRRYRTALDLAEDLRRLGRFEPVRARHPGPLLAGWRWCQRHPVLAATAAIAAVSIVVLSVLLLRINAQARRLGAWKDAIHAQQGMVAEPVGSLRQALAAARHEPQPEINEILLQILDCCHEAYALDPARCGFPPAEQPNLDAGGRSVLLGIGPDRVLFVDIGSGRVAGVVSTGVHAPVAAFAPGGGHLVVFGKDGDVGFFDLDSVPEPREARRRGYLEGDGREVRRVDLSPDGRRAVVSGAEGLLAVVDLSAGTRRYLTGHRLRVQHARFDGDGRHLVSIGCVGRDDAEGGREVWIWDVDAGSVALPIDLGGDEATWAEFDATGERLAVATFAGDARVVSTRSGGTLARLPLQPNGLWIAFSPRGDRVVTGNPEGLIVWDAASGARLRTHVIQERSPFRGAFSPDGSRLAVYVRDKTLRIYDTGSWDELKCCARHSRYVDDVIWSPDGRLIVTHDGNLRGWHAGFREFMPHFAGHAAAVESVAMSPDGSRVFSAGRDSSARIWDRATGRMIASLPHPAPVRRVRVTADGTRVLTVAADPVVRVWSAADGASQGTFRGGDSPVAEACFGEGDGSSVVAASADGGLRRWDTRSGALQYETRGRSRRVEEVALDAGRGWIASGARDRTVIIHDVASGRVLFDLEPKPGDRELPEHTSRGVRALAFDPKRPRLYSAHEDRAFGYWTLEADPRRVVHDAQDFARGRIGVDPSGRWLLVSHASSGAVILMDAGRLRTPDLAGAGLDSPSTWVSTLQFRPDGRFALIAARDGSLRLWDMLGPAVHNVIRHPSGAVLDACFSPDGHWVLMGAADGALRMWPVDAVRAAEEYLRYHDPLAADGR